MKGNKIFIELKKGRDDALIEAIQGDDVTNAGIREFLNRYADLPLFYKAIVEELMKGWVLTEYVYDGETKTAVIKSPAGVFSTTLVENKDGTVVRK